MKKENKTSYLQIILSIVLSFLVYFFLGVKFEISFVEKAPMALLFFLACYYFSKKGFSSLALFILCSITAFIGLTTAFCSSYPANGIININIKLNAWAVFVFTSIFTFIIMFLYKKMKHKDKYTTLLFFTFLFYWIMMAINAKYLDGWISENALVIPSVIILFFVDKWFKFSKISYSLIFLFFVLHVTGSHYTYSEVPLGYWMSEFFNLQRNHFDRVVHFCFGLLWAYPIREIFRRIADAKGFWSFWIPIELVLALSCIFELIEWAFAVIFGGDLGVAYLGTQGDVWDAQKDMALAGLGSILAMLITMSIILYYNAKPFFKEFRESFYIKSKQVLGEVALIKMMKKN